MTTSERSRGSQNGTAQKRKQPLEGNESQAKRIKHPNKQERLAEIIARFNLATNELFQLKEYKSLAFWNPADFSVAYQNGHVPELFESFLRESQYKLQWDPELESQDLSSIPLRLQKKVLLETEKKLLEKFPYKDEVIEASKRKEIDLIDHALNKKRNTKQIIKSEPEPAKSEDPATTSKPKPKPTKEKPKSEPKKSNEKKSNGKVKPEPEPEQMPEQVSEPELYDPEFFSSQSDDNDDNDDIPDTNYKIKTIKYSIPVPIVTHPSHIPKWRPDPTNSDMGGSNKNIIEFNPTPIKIIKQKDSWGTEPNIENRIHEFLDKNFKSGILDEPSENTPQEFANTLEQQINLLKKLRQKTEIDKTLQLNGDKIEQRRAVLPQNSQTRALDPYRATGTVFPKIQGASNQLTYLDHFVSQGMSFSKIHQQMRKQHQLRTRRIAQMIEQHFKKKKGEKDRLAKERELNLRRISRMAVQAVKRRWTQANKVYTYIQQQKEEEIKQIKGREHLSQMLEHSTQLLEAQLSKGRESDKEEEDEDEESSSDFSSSDDSGEENNLPSQEDNDMNLSVEQLRKKYAKLEDSTEPSSKPESEDSDDEDNDDDIDVSQGLSALYGQKSNGEKSNGSATVEVEYAEDQKALIKDESEGNPVLSDSDSSTDLDDSDESSSEEEEEVKHENEGLSSLFSKDLKEESEGDFEDKSSEDEASDMDIDEKEDEKEEETEIINGSKVKDVPVPSLLRGTLRPYQKQGLNWLASLYNNSTNGILADEMGLGKTIQTISLLAYLACEHHIWGPHLIVVPTSVMLNWEMEFKKFAPGFKVMTYYGSPQQRAQKRKGWNTPNAFHVCITSYQLVVHDHQSFKRRKWRYMILDEAHNIKNFRSTRWRALLNFNTENRLLLTGTPLQNNLMELWSLLYFLMPSSKVDQAMPDGFANLEDFQQWFGRPVDKILEQQGTGDVIDDNEKVTGKLDQETRNTVARLHQVLRPYLLRRLKKDVEKQMPGKYEHIVSCRLSKRQRYLYDDFMSRAKTKETLASGNFLSIINCLMQLRKVCNHPDLFEVRPIITSFAITKSAPSTFSTTNEVVRRLLVNPTDDSQINLEVLNLDITNIEEMNKFVCESAAKLQSSKQLQDQISQLDIHIQSAKEFVKPDMTNHLKYYQYIKAQNQIEVRDRLQHVLYLNSLRSERTPIYGESLLRFIRKPSKNLGPVTDIFRDFQMTIPKRVEQMGEIIDKYSVITPSVVALDMKDHLIPIKTQYKVMQDVSQNKIENPFSRSQTKLAIAFPDKSLLQYDCGKLQKLATLLQDLVSKGHRALIFTQMTKVLDILEQFLNIHGYRYSRLDGATKIEDRQLLTEQFNRDSRIPVFILSTRSGGLGINLTGADTVIFYDSDWNPAMDKQCQDRCHRIGQIRDVHIYRFVSEYTIESNILRKANQKRQLDNVVIQDGEFTTDYFGKFSVRDLVNDTGIADANAMPDEPLMLGGDGVGAEKLLAQAEDEDDRKAANEALKEVAVDDEDFDEESKSATAGATPSQTPGPETDVEAKVGSVKTGDVDVDYDAGIGHIDEYMLRFISEGYYWE